MTLSLEIHIMDSTEQISPRYCPRCNQKTNHSKSVNSIGSDGKEIREICKRCGALTATKMQGRAAPSSGIDGELPPEAEEHLDEADEPLEEESAFEQDPLDDPNPPF